VRHAVQASYVEGRAGRAVDVHNLARLHCMGHGLVDRASAVALRLRRRYCEGERWQ
jgi:hypothetical protein